MPAWIAPTVAVSLALMAVCVVAVVGVVFAALREGRERTGELARELGELRRELSPALSALNAFSEAGAEVARTARDEVEALAGTSAALRAEVHRGLRRARRRLDDFDALIEVLQEEVEDAALDVAVAVRTARNARGVLGRVGRALLPRRRERA